MSQHVCFTTFASVSTNTKQTENTVQVQVSMSSEEAPPLEELPTRYKRDDKSSNGSDRQRRTPVAAAIILVVLATVAIAVTVPLVLTKDDNKDANASDVKSENTEHPLREGKPPPLPNLPVVPPAADCCWNAGHPKVPSRPNDPLHWNITETARCESAIPTPDLLRRAVRAYFRNASESAVTRAYGSPIGTWCLSDQVDSLHSAFNQQSFPVNDGGNDYAVSNWNVGRVTDFRYAFQNTLNFDQDISAWDVSHAVRLDYAFTHSTSFRGKGIHKWNVSKVLSLQYTFCDATEFDNPDIGAWDVSRVVNMGSAFLRATSFAADLRAWDVANVMDMSFMFSHNPGGFIMGVLDPVYPPLLAGQTARPTLSPTAAPSAAPTTADALYGSLDSWNISNVQTFHGMFQNNNLFSHNLCAWGPHLRAEADVTNMFAGTKCPEQGDPDLGANPPGPFCFPCA